MKKLAPLFISAVLFYWLSRQLELPWHAVFNGDLEAALTALRQSVDHQGSGKLVAVAAMIALLPFVLVPVSALFIVAALSLPPLAAIASIVAGTAVNSALAWYAGRHLGEPLLRSLGAEGRLLGSLRQGVKQHPWVTALLCRFVPIPYAVVGISAAVAGLEFWPLFIASVVVVSPWAMLYVFATEAVRHGDLRYVGLASALLAGLSAAAWWAKGRSRSEQALPRLSPRQPAAGPVLTLYSLPGQAESLEARLELAGLRDEIGFEVDEVDLSARPDLLAELADHAPVLKHGERKLFSFQIDENALRVHLKEAR